jgi:hypothetical protein
MRVNTSGLQQQSEPTLFLDVDGVLNAFDFDPSLATFGDFEDHEVTVDQGNGFRMVLDLCLSRSMGKRLGALSAEIVWVTTWEHQADSIIAPLCGLPPGLGVLSRPTETTRPDGAWKFDEVRRAVGENMKPFVWIDDDIDIFRSGTESPRQWAANLPVRNQLIAPDPRSGLTHGQLEAVEDFLSSVV